MRKIILSAVAATFGVATAAHAEDGVGVGKWRWSATESHYTTGVYAKEQTMELVMFSQLYAGMRGLGHVYRATGDFLPAYASPPVPLEFPDGWAPDSEAFKSGLDLSTREMTDTDRANLTDWYERTLGYLPASIAFDAAFRVKS